jgi:hypothetical protein
VLTALHPIDIWFYTEHLHISILRLEEGQQHLARGSASAPSLQSAVNCIAKFCVMCLLV